MRKLIYERNNDDASEPIKISFDIHEELDIYEFRTLCKRMASAIGYHFDSISDAFGGENSKEEPLEQARMHELLNHKAIEEFFDYRS